MSFTYFGIIAQTCSSTLTIRFKQMPHHKYVGQYDANELPVMLPIYYTRHFPQNIFCRWLACGSSPQPLSNRELSFTLADDVYLRYLSISNQKEFLTLLQKKCPFKLDVGAVYNTKPSMGRHDGVVLARELVFDIDLTDYDEVRTCCQEAKVCEKCWKFMIIACNIIDKALKEDFGFQNILWVFSGRRGIHCWVSDYEARTLDTPGRGALADYLCLITGGENQYKKVHLGSDNLHSSIRRALQIIDKYFEQVLQDQEFFASTEGLKAFLKLIPDEALKAQTAKRLEKMPASSLERWQEFRSIYDNYCRENAGITRRLKYLIEEIKIQYCYPRLDVNVTKGFNHLLKSPFSIHPKTGKVSVVFKPKEAERMKLNEIPTIDSLLDDNSPESELHRKNMTKSVKNFQEVVFSLEKAEALRRRNDANVSLEF
ncbi:DNA primase small subunit isoform X1 [Amyelois transitella]|uniref:DNA primase small subunit isoform X1 n=1 Tax=Amyelois transitella TaxID=680683 RepID=UPI0029901A17|nr:DNA primase small subunit isoform X1 [Amyelois transitella]